MRKMKQNFLKALEHLVESRSRQPQVLVMQGVLYLLSLLYAGLLHIRLWLYSAGVMKKYRTDACLISVGNITVGGTGKTPLVAEVVRFLADRSAVPAIVSRGYKDNRNGAHCADEPLMLRRQLPQVPVFETPRRRDGIRQAAGAGATHVVLDDAFQQLALVKALDIVCLDAARPFGNGLLLPRGTLRLPLAYLKLADIAVITRAHAAPENVPLITETVRRYNPDILVCTAEHVPRHVRRLTGQSRYPLSWLKDRPVAMLCGIARPEHFRALLAELGARIQDEAVYPDHHQFSEAELVALGSRCAAGAVPTIITTAKDAARLPEPPPDPGVEIVVLEIEVQLEYNAQECWRRIGQTLRR